jgi:integrase
MFYLRDTKEDNTTIVIIVRYKGQRYKFSTGEKVVSKYWNQDKERCRDLRKYEDGIYINQRLDIWEKHIKKILNDYGLKFQVPTEEEFKKTLEIEAKGEEEMPVIYLSDFAKEYKKTTFKAEGTKKAYQTAINWLEKYEEKYGKIKFSDINKDFYNRFQSFVFSGINSPNFFGGLIKQIKVFMNEAKELKLHNNEEYKASSFKRVEIESDNIYLSVDELIKIHSLKITEDFIKEQFKEEIKINNVRQKVKSLELVRGRFLIGCFTALRVSDYSRIQEINVNNNFITIRSTVKTGAPVIIPIHWVVKEILDKGFDLSDKISDVKLNKQVKVLCRYAGITDPVTLSKFEKGNRIDVVKPKYEWVTTHTARRSGATNMYKAGIPTLSIMKITGHKTEKAFLKYIKVTQEENAEILSKHPFFNKG